LVQEQGSFNLASEGGGLRGRASLSVGAPLGSWGLVYRGLEQQALETGISLHRGPLRIMRGRGTPFTGNYKRYLKEGSGKGASLSMGTL